MPRITRRSVRWTLVVLAVLGAGWFLSEVVGLRRQWTLHAVLGEADRIRVRTGGTCHRMPDAELTVFEETDPARIREVVAAIRLMPGPQSRCMCCGYPSIEFYRGDELITTIGYHHGRSIRWPDRWKWDVELTSDSARSLNQWLAEHNVPAEHGEW